MGEKSMDASDLRFLFIIGKRKQKEAILKELLKYETILCDTVYGTGWVKSNEFLAALGLVGEQNKIVILCLVNRSKIDGIFSMLNDQFHFNKPNTGIAFTVPVEK